MMNAFLMLADTSAPTDLLSTILCIVVGIVVAAVCWIASTVINHSTAIAAMQAVQQQQTTARDAACLAHKQEIDRRMVEQHSVVDQRFASLTEWLKKIEDKLDRALEEHK